MTELKSSLSFMNESMVKGLQKEMKDKVDTKVFADFKEEIVKKIDDLEDRSKRNKLVFQTYQREKKKTLVAYILYKQF